MAASCVFFEFVLWPTPCLIALRRRDLCPALQAGDGSMLRGVPTRSDEKMNGSSSTGEPQIGDQTQTFIPLLYKYTVGLLRTHLSPQLCAGQMAEDQKHKCNLKLYRGSQRKHTRDGSRLAVMDRLWAPSASYHTNLFGANAGVGQRPA